MIYNANFKYNQENYNYLGFLVADTTYYKKNYIYKVYAKSTFEWDSFKWDIGKWSTGLEKGLIAIWRNDVISEPTFQSTINSGDAEMVIRLARPFDNFGENLDVELNNKVECIIYDKEEPNGKTLFSGFIAGYMPTLEDDNQYLDVRVKGYTATLNRIMKDNSGNTTITYTNQDPSNILKDVINKFQNDLGEIGYSGTNIQLTNTQVTYTFNTVTYKEALDKIIEFSPFGWFYRIDSTNKIYFQEKPIIINHQISTKKDVLYLQPERNIDDFANEIYFIGGETGGSNLFLFTKDTTSIDDYGKQAEKVFDAGVTNTQTATKIIQRRLQEKANPTRRTIVRIADSNGSTYSDIGYDIESIKVGENISISELTGAIPNPTLWDNFVWEQNLWDNVRSAELSDLMQIVRITYNPDFLELEATTRLPEINRRIEDINLKVESNNLVGNPTIPTEV